MAEFLASANPWLVALIIFVARVCDMALDTVRVLFVVRGRKGLAWMLGVAQALIFVVAISSVLSGELSVLSVLAYSIGFATGNVVGMAIEERLAVGHIQLTIVSPTRGAAITEQLRSAGYAVTEIFGRGKSGTVTILHVGVKRKEVSDVETVILEVDPQAFITMEDVRTVRRGFYRS